MNKNKQKQEKKMENIKLNELIEKKMIQFGITKQHFSKTTGSTPAHVSTFLRGKGMINRESTELGLGLIGVNLNTYSKRLKLINSIALTLKSKGFSAERIMKMNKQTLINVCGGDKRKLKYFIELEDKKSFDEIIEDELIEVENIFQLMRSLIALQVSLRCEQSTPMKIKKAINELLNCEEEEGTLDKYNFLYYRFVETYKKDMGILSPILMSIREGL